MIYLHDSFEECKKFVESTYNILKRLEFIINLEKSILTSSIIAI